MWREFFDDNFISEVHYIVEPDTYKKFISWRKDQTTKRGAPPSDRTINIDLMTIRHVFKWAIEEGIAKFNPFANIRLFKEKKPDTPRFFSVEELELIEKTAQDVNPTMHKVIAVLVRTGMRSGELCQLQPSDIDMNLQRIVLKTTYTKNRRQRVIPFCDKVKSIFKDMPERERVFTTRTGKPQTPDNVNRRFRTILKKCGIQNANVHTFRS